MRLIPGTVHRILDFVTVVAFALAPSVLGLTRSAAALSYLLAAIHLAMTLMTRFSPSDRRPVPLPLHGAVESVVGVALAALPWLAGWSGTPRIVFTAAGMAILVVWALSQYRLATYRSAA